ncbi:putative lysine-specific demethylase ELF6 [Camellia lanceoleosa]|uniref:Lysine-specific demethylase ELF6 n=1 Tax=Camellia lanceoleosa TaxID=1840588 RepID=A0ACC0J2Z6_9ERIC|nr:putative lysine-specific demethylase ELF6 [Camellia lanceoleosa]
MEGTAGWKLSNSPWNLQVIARSPGSLTRFMPDDISGVTSPMVYIGMLFSWFAWHVEDHELHSLNFLHTGSPKTWYAVPGDYAFSFEEVIRNQAYGGNIDRLASLTLLGEKTTLLSPEVVVKSGIPCCRLIQNPCEFVATFPRAYHVGFSHCFNCGEAANFGTSKWLKVAKDAAVRRAAMNYLPMLSHQQLLYLLTMSFVSRDRQKEERELSVKKAFLEDILILWDLESLPSPSKESERCIATVVTTPREDVCSENKNIVLFDSRTLACVACGILGFPFMCVVQPSERVSMSLLQDVGVSKPLGCHSHPVLHDMIEGFISDGMKDTIEQNESNVLHHPNGASSSAKSINSMACSSEDLSSGWSATRGFLRPRIFCLEHAIQIEEMLRSKDFQKMKAHAAVIAEEIGSPFRYNEIPLDNASQEGLNLIDLAIDDEEHDECGEDWTTK